MIYLFYYFLIINIFAFGLFGYDKYKAKNSGWRIKENYLYLVMILGGFVGALFATIFFKHKTRKLKFQLIFRIIIFLWIIFLLYYMLK